MTHLHLPSSLHNSIYWRFGIAVFLNAMLAFTQIFYAHHADSVSLLSDAIHNLGDVLGLLTAWSAQILANSTRYTARYTYGYQKSTLLAALVNAMLLLCSVGIIIYETVMKLTHVSAMDELKVLFVATLGILINGFSALLFIQEKDNNINIKAAFLHLTVDALTSFGVVISALLIYYGGYQWVDSLMAFVIAGVILVNAWRLLRSSLDLLLGAVPPSIDIKQVNQYLQSIIGVKKIQRLHVWAISSEQTALTAHLVMGSHTNPLDYSAINKELTQRFGIQHVTLQPVYTNH